MLDSSLETIMVKVVGIKPKNICELVLTSSEDDHLVSETRVKVKINLSMKAFREFREFLIFSI